MPDGAEISYHMDCHAIAAGCEICRDRIAGAGGAKGDELRQYLTAGPEEN